jgi:hypothetical protein
MPGYAAISRESRIGSIKTLSDARAHMLTLSEREQLEPRWQDVARYVLKAVEERAFIFFARLAVYKAVHRTDQAAPPAPDVRKPDTRCERRRARRVQARPDGFGCVADRGLSAVAWDCGARAYRSY